MQRSHTRSFLWSSRKKCAYVDESFADHELYHLCGALEKTMRMFMGHQETTNSIISVQLQKTLCVYSWIVYRSRTVSFLWSSRMPHAHIDELFKLSNSYHLCGAPENAMRIFLSRLQMTNYISFTADELLSSLWTPEKTMRIFLSRLHITNYTICVELRATLRAHWGVI